MASKKRPRVEPRRPAKPASKPSPKAKAKAKATTKQKPAKADTPTLFRLNLEVGDLDRAAAFYGELFGITGARHAGSRVYLVCGSVTLQVVAVGDNAHPAAKALYFTVRDLEAVHARATALGCLSRERVHGEAGGAITVRPWGERSFYAEDPWHNPLCFVEAGTVYG
jgi:predicted enzyme related to lactoylglutathione lyase